MNFTIGDRTYDEEAAKVKIENADQHIAKIEEENAQIRAKLDEYIEATAKRLSAEADNSSKPEDQPKQESRDDNQVGLSAEDIERLVAQKVNELRMQDTATSNKSVVEQALTTQFGDQAKEQLNAKAQEMGVTPEVLDSLVSNSPKVVLDWFSVDSQPTIQQTTGSIQGANTVALNMTGNGPKEGTYAWWKELRKSNPKAYNSPKNAHQRILDAQKLGDAFYE